MAATMEGDSSPSPTNEGTPPAQGGLQRTQSKAKKLITGLFRRRSDAVQPLGDQDPGHPAGGRRRVSDGDHPSTTGGGFGSRKSSRRHRDGDDPGLRDERRRRRELEQQAQYGQGDYDPRRRTNSDVLLPRPGTGGRTGSATQIPGQVPGDAVVDIYPSARREDKGKARASRSGDLLQQQQQPQDYPRNELRSRDGLRDGQLVKKPTSSGSGYAPPPQQQQQQPQRRRLSSWPPSGMSSTEELRLGPAMELIARGVPAFKGHRRAIPHASPPEAYFALYTTTAGTHGDESDAATLHDSMTALSTLRTVTTATTNTSSSANGGSATGNTDKEKGSADKSSSTTAVYPWETLEQPSMAFAYGKRPGTITLNHWVSKSSSFPTGIPLRDPGAPPRAVDLIVILDRLKELEHGLERDEERDTEENMYRLYRRFLKDPDARTASRPHKKPVPMQIMDLVMALSSNSVVSTASPPPSRRGPSGSQAGAGAGAAADQNGYVTYGTGEPDLELGKVSSGGAGRGAGGGGGGMSKAWIDFTNPRNQVVTKFIYDTSPENYDACTRFFYQLLLGLELELRINSPRHEAAAKERLMAQIPPRIQYDMALARRWRDYVRIEHWGHTADELRLRCKLRKRQVKMLRRFAQMMKWPNLEATLDALRKSDEEGSTVGISSHAMAFFSGLILPGPTFPFLLMNALIDIDPDKATDELALLTHVHPNCGFQYRSSYTYWTSTCIVGKVLAPTCHEVAGWVGPAKPTSDLDRSEIARIRTRRPKDRMNPQSVLAISEDSDPLGPPAKIYPVEEYELLTPDTEDTMDTVRVELLGLTPVPDRKASSGPTVFDASIQFAIDGSSWPLRLMHDVSFIHAWPCTEGPHPLYFDYRYTTVKADEVVGIREWGRRDSGMGMGSGDGSARSTPLDGARGVTKKVRIKEENADQVLAIEAFGVRDNEVLARAWCAHWGLCAIVADLTKTCMACAIREAYAANLTVVILVEDQPHGTTER
ncbi:hypothetical protein Micbo1qcDRAFT_4675 [Microdochium bolleyi]|uniref:Uncharacterized protein n=1 Tax=Microdochium bolleyi TaxID=196109 RepID=A0A136JIK7_9PEZI|nr:hypothetical protein Micbo1qcDRAFT_4675 [Microdochium bolleyi]